MSQYPGLRCTLNFKCVQNIPDFNVESINGCFISKLYYMVVSYRNQYFVMCGLCLWCIFFAKDMYIVPVNMSKCTNDFVFP